jgi:hypothetical protein
MAFASVRATTFSEETADVTAHDVSLSGIQAGDRAVLFAIIDNDGTSVTISGMPSGWNQIKRRENPSGAGHTIEVWEKVNCTGGESSFQYSSSSAQKSMNRVLLISGSHESQAMAASAGAFGGGVTTPDPDNLAAPWGAEDNLWIAFYGAEDLRMDAHAYPANYGANQLTLASTTNDGTRVNYGIATRELAAASENPGPFTSGANDRQSAFTFVIRPSAGGVTAVVAEVVETDTAQPVLFEQGGFFPNPPTGLQGTPVSGDRIVLQWTAVEDPQGRPVVYELERDSVVVATDLSDPAFVDRDLNPDTTYTYRVRAVIRVLPFIRQAEETDVAFPVTTELSPPIVVTIGQAVESTFARVVSFGAPPGAIPVSSHAALVTAVANNPPGSIFLLTQNMNWSSTQKLPTKPGNQYWGTPGNEPTITGPGWNVVGGHFVATNDDNCQLHHLIVRHFGPDQNSQNGAMIQAFTGVSATGWLVDHCELSHTRESVLRWADGWTVRDSYLHHGGRHCMSGGGKGAQKRIERVEWAYGGTTHDGITAVSSSDRGGCKFALTGNMVVDDLFVHDSLHGLWYDLGNENIEINRFRAEDCPRTGLFFEVSYGPFVVNGADILRCASVQDPGAPFPYPAYAGFLLALTPDVTANDVFVDGGPSSVTRHGMTILFWNHPALNFTFIDSRLLGNENIEINDSRVTRLNRPGWDAGLNGGHGATQNGDNGPTRPNCDIHYNNLTLDPGATIRNSLLHYAAC